MSSIPYASFITFDNNNLNVTWSTSSNQPGDYAILISATVNALTV